MEDSTPPLPRNRPRNRRFQSLSGRILFFVLLSTSTTAAAVGWTAIRSTEDFLRRGVERAFPNALSQTGARVRGLLDQAVNDVARAAAVVESHCRRDGPGCSPEDAGLDRTLEALRTRFDSLGPLAVVATEGHILARSGGDPTGLEGRLSRQTPVPGSPLSLVPGVEPGSLDLAVQRPLGGAEPWAVVHGWLRRELLAAELGTESPVGDARMLLVDARGRVLERAAGSGPRRLRVPESVLAADRSVVEYPRQDGRSLLGASLFLREGLYLVVESPRESVFAPVSELLARVVLIDLAIVVMLSLLAHQIARAIARPIRALSEGVLRIAEGDLEVQIEAPSASDEIGLLTRTFNQMTARLRDSRKEIQAASDALRRRNEELQGANEVLEQLSITDGLTKLHNHRFFQDHLTREIKRVRRTHEPLSMLLIDIDDFKRLNDRLGHAAGDELLKAIARSLNGSVRESDFLARYGGEEFVVVAANTDLAGAVHLAEKVRTDVAESSFVVDESMEAFRMTISIGTALYQGDRKAFFQAADRALYRAKADGKNCVS
ncbi:MAG: diguanylate cyclase [Myxococcota bacterium]